MSDYKKMIDEIYEYVNSVNNDYDFVWNTKEREIYFGNGKKTVAKNILDIFDEHDYKNKHLKDA